MIAAAPVCAPALGEATASATNIAQQHSPGNLAGWQSRFEGEVFETQSGIILPYRIARPCLSSPRPLVLVLHGSGAIGSDNKRQLGPFAASWAQLNLNSSDPPIVLVPQVPERSADYILCEGLPCASRPGPSFDALLELVDSVVASGGTDPGRVYVVGFSMGGSAALQLALARPKLIAGMVLFAPVPPPTARAAELRHLPLLVVHGSEDTENPFNVMSDWMNALQGSGGMAILTVRKGMRHQVPDDMLIDERWRQGLLDGSLLHAPRKKRHATNRDSAAVHPFSDT